MDASVILGMAAAGVVTSIAITGDIGGAVEALGDAINDIWHVDDPPSATDIQADEDYAAFRAIDQYGTEWDQVDSGWWE